MEMLCKEKKRKISVIEIGRERVSEREIGEIFSTFRFYLKWNYIKLKKVILIAESKLSEMTEGKTSKRWWVVGNGSGMRERIRVLLTWLLEEFTFSLCMSVSIVSFQILTRRLCSSIQIAPHYFSLTVTR